MKHIIVRGQRRKNSGREERRMTIDELKKEIDYHGCTNCKYQIEPLRACEWLEHGGDGVVHILCPKWEKRKEE